MILFASFQLLRTIFIADVNNRSNRALSISFSISASKKPVIKVENSLFRWQLNNFDRKSNTLFKNVDTTLQCRIRWAKSPVSVFCKHLVL